MYDIQSRWIGPNSFTFKAECDFDGSMLAEKLKGVYGDLVENAHSREQINEILSWYAEDITRLIEIEVKEVETIIQTKFPQAAFIELEPDSRKSYTRYLDEIKSSKKLPI